MFQCIAVCFALVRCCHAFKYTALVHFTFILQAQCPYMFDIKNEGLGFVQFFGELVIVPFIYILPVKFVAAHPRDLHPLEIALIVAILGQLRLCQSHRIDVVLMNGSLFFSCRIFFRLCGWKAKGGIPKESVRPKAFS